MCLLRIFSITSGPHRPKRICLTTLLWKEQTSWVPFIRALWNVVQEICHEQWDFLGDLLLSGAVDLSGTLRLYLAVTREDVADLWLLFQHYWSFCLLHLHVYPVISILTTLFAQKLGPCVESSLSSLRSVRIVQNDVSLIFIPSHSVYSRLVVKAWALVWRVLNCSRDTLWNGGDLKFSNMVFPHAIPGWGTNLRQKDSSCRGSRQSSKQKVNLKET